jgi:hypothetical protein
MSRRVEVDRQLDEFVDLLTQYLGMYLNVHTDFTYWEETNEHQVDTILDIGDAIDDAFEPIMARHESVSDVWNALDAHRDLIQNTTWAAVNVPFPRDPYRHMDRVFMNIQILASNTHKIREIMLKAAHRTEVIQRNWRRCVADPNYEVCKRRLLRESSELKCV